MAAHSYEKCSHGHLSFLTLLTLRVGMQFVTLRVTQCSVAA